MDADYGPHFFCCYLLFLMFPNIFEATHGSPKPPVLKGFDF